MWTFEREEKSAYLCVVIDEVGKERPASCKNGKREQKLGNLQSQIKSKYISKEYKLIIYKTVIRLIVTYACEN